MYFWDSLHLVAIDTLSRVILNHPDSWYIELGHPDAYHEPLLKYFFQASGALT